MKLWLSILLGLASAQTQAQPARTPIKEIKVAAASDLQPVMPAFAAAWEKKTGTRLSVSFGSSGTLATQIVNGAPFDLFLAADYLFPEKIVAAGLSEQQTPVPYARGTLVLWARKDAHFPSLDVEVLNDPRVTRIAVADEFHAPYGAAAYATMRWMKTLNKLKPKLVVGENIGQTAQFVVSGNAQIGFLSLTAAQSPQLRSIGDYVLLPFVYPPIRQCAVVLKNGPHREEADAFLKWITSPEVQQHMREFGLTPVD